jgi:hypothetical protein
LPAGNRLHPVFNVDLLRKHVDGRAEFPERPEENARPGPAQLAEDPAAGGPAAGEPSYEVEAVIGKRQRGRKVQYRLRWRGWPLEQASWIDAGDCDDCAELVADFEQRRVDAHRRVSTLHMQQLRNMEDETQQWVTMAAVRRRPAVSPAQQLTERLEAQAAIESNAQRPAGQPAPKADKKGQVVVPSQRCIAQARRGQCGNYTAHGAHCWTHRAQLFGTRIRDSTIPGAGKGLWAATRDFQRNEVIAQYTGDYVQTAAGDAPQGFGGSAYVLQLSRRVSIDAARTNTADGRMVNDVRGSGKRPNVRFCINQGDKTATLRAIGPVKAGTELLASYGGQYWRQQQRSAGTGAIVEPAMGRKTMEARKSALAVARPLGGGARKVVRWAEQLASGRADDPIVLGTVAAKGVQVRVGATRLKEANDTQVTQIGCEEPKLAAKNPNWVKTAQIGCKQQKGPQTPPQQQEAARTQRGVCNIGKSLWPVDMAKTGILCIE